MDEVEKIKQQLKHRKPKLMMPQDSLISTGSTMLNLACSGLWNGGFAKGEYILLVGDSMSGKTWLSLSCLAEAARKKSFRKYRFIQDNPEAGSKMDMAYYFGQKVVDRLCLPPSGGPSESVQEFYYNVDEALEEGPCIYILDSMDALDDESDTAQFEKEKAAHRKGKQVTGSYGTGKPKANSQGLRRLTRKLEETGSILIIISQTRDNIGFGAQFNPKTRSGGRALRFFAQMEIWTSIVKTLTKKVNDKPRQQGVITRCQVKKNRHNGQLNQVDMPIYHSYGIDDMTSCIDYLVDEGQWKETKGVIVASDLEIKGRRSQLLKLIEDNGWEDVVRELTGEVWQRVSDEINYTGRKRRYE